MAVPVDAITYSRDEESTSAWYHDYIDTQEAWNLIDKIYPDKSSRERVKVASIDCGCNLFDSELGANIDRLHSVQFAIDEGKLATPYYAVNISHGTDMAKFIAATSNNGTGPAGIAAGNHNDVVSLMALNVYSSLANKYGDENQRYTTTDDIVNALNYAAENGAKVIHICIGHNKHTLDARGNVFDDRALQKAIRRVVKKYDVVIVAPAGNLFNTAKWYPSDMKGVIGTINTKQYTNIKSKSVKVYNSSYGKRKILSAPGNHHGTSGASAVVAGVAALVRYANPKLNATQVTNILKSTATDLYRKGRDKQTGYGNVNAYAAVAKALKKARYRGFANKIKAPKCREKVVDISTISVARRKAKLSWSAVESDRGYVNGYTILRAGKKHGKYRQIGKTRRTRYTDRKLKAGKKYFYKIQPFGTTLDGKVMKPTSVKKATAVSAVAFGKAPKPRITADTGDSVSVAWKKVARSRCELQYSLNEQFDQASEIRLGIGAKSCTITGLQPDAKYYIRVRRIKTVKGRTYYTAWTKLVREKEGSLND